MIKGISQDSSGNEFGHDDDTDERKDDLCWIALPEEG